MAGRWKGETVLNPIGLAWLESDWMDWIGLDWIGLDWIESDGSWFFGVSCVAPTETLWSDIHCNSENVTGKTCCGCVVTRVVHWLDLPASYLRWLVTELSWLGRLALFCFILHAKKYYKTTANERPSALPLARAPQMAVDFGAPWVAAVDIQKYILEYFSVISLCLSPSLNEWPHGEMRTP